MFFNSTFSGTVYNFGETKKNPDKVRQKYLNAFFGPTAIGTSIFRAIRCQFHQHFLCAFFVQKYFLCLEFGFEQTFVQKMRTKNACKKCWWNWRQVSISSKLYTCVFCTKANFSSYIWLCNFLSPKFCVCKTMMKLTAGFNFIKILKADSLYKSVLCSFDLLTVWAN